MDDLTRHPLYKSERPKTIAWLVESRARGRNTPWLFYSLMKDEKRAQSLAKNQDSRVEYRATRLVKEV